MRTSEPCTSSRWRRSWRACIRRRCGSTSARDRDIELLQHIQELTTEGVGLAGVKRILELEAALETAEEEIERLRARVRKARQEVADAEERVHRKYRRDLVPVTKAVVRVRRS